MALQPCALCIVLGVFFAGAHAGNISAKVACTHLYPAGVHKIEHDNRYFLLLVPERLPTDTRTPVVVDVPGYSESPYYQVALTGIRSNLNAAGWLGVVPFGTAPVATSTCCPATASQEDCEAGKTLDKINACSFNAGTCCGAAALRNVDDVGYVRSIVQWLEEHMCADTDAVFATGFSNGGMMSNRLGCDAADLFKGVAPVAGNVRVASCSPRDPVGWVSLCGTRDGACNGNFEQTAVEWALRNGCPDRDPVPTYQTTTTKCYAYEGCRAHTEYCVIENLDHEWPGHSRPDGTSPEQPSTNVDATAFIFDRFESMLQEHTTAKLNRTLV